MEGSTLAKLIDDLAGNRDANAVQTLAQAFGISAYQAQSTLQTVLPELSRQLEKLTLSRGGIAELIEIYGRAAHDQTLTNPELAAADGVRREGDVVLEKILGTKHQSRVVAARAARQSELPVETVKRMLPAIATMLMGALEQATTGQIADVVGKRKETSSLRAFGNDPFANQQPLPVPGDNIPSSRRGSNPYGDLSDVIRKNGGRPGSSGSLAGIIRSIIGSLLGFKSNGIISWIIRMVVLRYGWSILQFIIRRVLLGR